MAAVPQLQRTFKELGEYGKNTGREIRELERNVADELKRIRDFVNLVTGSVHTIGNRSFLRATELMSRSGALLGGTSVVPVNMLDTEFGPSFAATLPPRAAGLQCIVKDAKNNAATYNVTVSPAEDLVNIDGSPSADVINIDGDGRWYFCDGQDWWRLRCG